MSKRKRENIAADGDVHQHNLVRLLEGFPHGQSRHEVFADFIEMSCLALSNAVDRRQFEPREARYMDIVKRYAKDDLAKMPEMLAELTLSLEQRAGVGDFGDVLGAVYMQLGLGNDRAGQFFTPYHVSKLMAMMLIAEGREIEEQKFLDVMEPACGAGGMVIAMADAIVQTGMNYQQRMHATCIDIDARCVHMAYLQLSLLHIPAIVLHGNGLTDEVWARWYTPAHILGGWTARLKARRAAQPIPVLLPETETPAQASAATDEVPPVASPTSRGTSSRVEQLRLF